MNSKRIFDLIRTFYDYIVKIRFRICFYSTANSIDLKFSISIELNVWGGGGWRRRVKLEIININKNKNNFVCNFFVTFKYSPVTLHQFDQSQNFDYKNKMFFFFFLMELTYFIY